MTGGHAVTGDDAFLPPLVIFSTSTKQEDNMAVNNQWIVSYGKKRQIGPQTVH